MADFIYEVATEYNYPNLTVYRRFLNGTQSGWEIRPNEGYVMYDVNANDTEIQFNPETGMDEEVPVIYYYTSWNLPLNYNFANFHWAAKLRTEVDENYIFGLDNDHEIM